MTELVALLQSIAPVISATTLRQLSQVVYGMWVSNGRMTLLELSRWTEKGGRYRTIQRLYHRPMLWLQIQWSQFHRTDREYIAAGDEVGFGKAGQETYGVGRFFSSLQNRVIPGLSFFVFSLIDVQERQSYPLQAVQIIKEPKQPQKKEKEKPSQTQKRPVGRPKGSQNRKKEPPSLSPELLRIQPILQGMLTVRYLVMDGHFGNDPSAWMVLQTGLPVVSKFRSDAAL